MDNLKEGEIMNFDHLVKLLQCLCYLTVATVILLIYLKAGYGLFVTVNPEYQKKVTERLDWLSRTLFDEFDWDSPNHFVYNHSVEDAVGYLNQRYIKHKKAILASGELYYGIPNADYARLKSLIQKVKSDPFIPKGIRGKVTQFLEGRMDAIDEVHWDNLSKYKAQLERGINDPDLEGNKDAIKNSVLEDLFKRGYGYEKMDQEVHRLRQKIQDYLERFSSEKLQRQ